MPAKIPVPDGLKRCPTCKSNKPFGDFYHNRSTPDGYTTECKQCGIARQQRRMKKPEVRARINAQRHASPEIRAKLREQYKACYQKRKQKVAAYSKSPEVRARNAELAKAPHRFEARIRYFRSDRFLDRLHERIADDPERFKARWKVNNAVRDGKLPRIKTLLCACGKQAQQYHHHNGYAPEHALDVVPMCRPCHRKADGK